MAAAIGAGLDIHEPVGSMVVDVGGGTTETAVISLGGIVAYRAVRCGGYDMDAAVQEYVRQKHGVAISDRTGEELKIAIGSALPSEQEQRAEVRGREVTTGRPCAVVLTGEEIRYALAEQVELVVDTVLGLPGRCAARAGPGHHLRGHPPAGGGCAAAGPGRAPGAGDRGPRPRGGRPAGVRRPGRRALPRLVRQPAPDLRRRRVLTDARRRPGRTAPSVDGEQVLGDLADLPVAVVEAAAQRGLDLRARRRRRGPPPPADGRPACRPARRAPPPGPPGRRSPRARPRPPRGTAGRRGRRRPAPAGPARRRRRASSRSPSDHAVISTTDGSGSASSSSHRHLGIGSAASSAERRRTDGSGSARPATSSSSAQHAQPLERAEGRRADGGRRVGQARRAVATSPVVAGHGHPRAGAR